MNITENLSDISLHYFALVRQLSSKFELTLSQALVVLYIPFEGITISELSQKLGIDISTMTRNIQRIEKKELITREKNLNDRRSTKLLLSKRGTDISNSLTLEISQHIENILNKYNLENSHQIHNNLEHFSWELYLYREKLK